jgi:glycosyltransferase involved in cell wall biosynthesis
MGFLYSGGGERVVIEQAKGLRERGHSVKVYSPVIRWNKCFPKELTEVQPSRIVPPLQFSMRDNVITIPFPFREASAMLASVIFPFKFREIADCDVLLCHSQPSMAIGYRIAKLLGIPYVGYLHQFTSFLHERPSFAGDWSGTDFAVLSFFLSKFRTAIRPVDRLVHAEAARLLFNSEWTRKRFVEEYGLSGHVCYPAIRTTAMKTDETRHDELITACRHYAWKRIDIAIDVLAQLPANVTLEISSERTPLTSSLERQASALGVFDRVKFTGFIEDAMLYRHFASSRVYVQPSVEEPFGLSILEAQSLGTPAVAWGDAGGNETVLNGETGYVVAPYDMLEYANRVRSLVSDNSRWNAMSRNARVWATTFSWEDHLNVLEGVLDEERK